MDIKTIPNETTGRTWISIEVEFMGICPIPDKPYCGLITVEYVPDAVLLEWDSFAEWLRNQRDRGLTAENFLDFVFRNLKAELRPRSMRVTLEVISAFHLPVKLYQEEGDLL